MSIILLFDQPDVGVRFPHGARTRSGSATGLLVTNISASAASTRMRSGSVLGGAYSPPAPAPPPPTRVLTTPARWSFYDLDTGELGTFNLNPDGGGEVPYQHQVAFSLIYDSGPMITLMQDALSSGQFTASVFSQSDWDFYQYWFNKDNEIVLTDDMGRQLIITVTDFNFDRQRKAGNPWFHVVTAKFLVLAATDI